ncbi:MAG: endonuclease/exonuclease/phosphatase family protein, partial [Rhodothermales bacterium]
VFTTHLAHRSEAELTRTTQVSEIKQHVGFRGRDSIPAIIVGDFNATPDTPSIRNAVTADSAGSWIDAFAAVNPDDDDYSYPAEDPNKRIDYVFLADPSRLMPVSARMVFDETRGEKMLSDHLGVVVDFVKR